MLEGVNIAEFGLFGGAFIVLLGFFIKFITRVMADNRTDAITQREDFMKALHEIANEVKGMGKELAIVSVKLDEHIRSSDKNE